MFKENYIAPELRIVIFDDASVITASTQDFIPDRDDPIELPFVPAN